MLAAAGVIEHVYKGMCCFVLVCVCISLEVNII